MTPVKKQNLLCILLLLTICSCKKEIKNVPDITVTGNTSKDGYPNYPFNWETSSVMMPGYNPIYNPSLPWTSQTGSYINQGIASDYKSADGWILIYNSFNPNYYSNAVPSGGLYFALYNVYRGILRFYLFIPPGYDNNNNQIEHGLSTAGLTSSMLNFEAGDVVDASGSTSTFTKTNTVSVAYSGGWYDMQYEIAYDPKVATAAYNYPNFELNWNSQTIAITQIELDGTQIGTITGNVSQPSSGFNLAGTLINLGVGLVELFTIGDLTGSSNDANLAQSAASNGLAGNITGFLSGIFGGNSNNTSEVDLKMNTNISMNGTLVGSQSLAPNSFVAPGQGITSGNGSNPSLYPSNLMGVFNLPARPTVYVHTVSAQYSKVGSDRSYNGSKSTFTIDPNFQNTIVYNPTVTSLATISVSKVDLMLLPNPATQYGLFGANGTYETDGDVTYIRNATYVEQENVTLQYFGNAYIRLTLKVTPKPDPVTGYVAPSSTITKTFLANTVQN